MSRSGERWLVVVDLQRVFADPDSPWGMAGFGDVVPVVNALADRYAGRTVLTRFVPPSRPRGSWRDYYRTWDFALRAESAPMWELVPELVAAGAPVVDAPTMGKWTPALQAVVGEEPELVLCGVSTDCCVLSTALAAADGGARVRVVADGCAGLTPADHRRALAAMRLYAPQLTVHPAAELPLPPA